MNNINYNDFQNICRTCLLTCDNKLLLDCIISDVYYKLIDKRFDLNDELPQQMCRKCYEKITGMHEFSLQCKQAYSRLMECLFEFKNLQVTEAANTNIQETSEFEEITIEERKINFVKDEEEYFTNAKRIKKEKDPNIYETEFVRVEELYATNESVIDELQIKPKNVEDQNISVQDEFIENVKYEEMSDDDTNHNDLNNDTNNRTSVNEASNEISLQSYKCDLCSKTFKFKRNLNVHKRKHGIKSPLMCKLCNRAFKYLGQLNRHKLIHRTESPYLCKICYKAFISLSDLCAHNCIKISTSEKQIFNTHYNDYYREKPNKRPYNNTQINEITNQILLAKRSNTSKTRRDYYLLKTYDTVTVNNQTSLIKIRKKKEDALIYMIPEEDIFERLSAIHISCGHGSRDKMIHILRQNASIPRPCIDIFLKSCQVCQLKKKVKLN